MKKTYITPGLEVVELMPESNLMLSITSSPVDGGDALSPSFDDEELEGYFGQLKTDTATLA